MERSCYLGSLSTSMGLGLGGRYGVHSMGEKARGIFPELCNILLALNYYLLNQFIFVWLELILLMFGYTSLSTSFESILISQQSPNYIVPME